MGFHPYLYFDRNCREAFTRYHEIFGGELTMLTGHDAPPDSGIAAEQMDLVMHTSLLVDGTDLLMASDSYDAHVPMAGNFVHYSTGDLERGKAVLAALCEQGDVLVEGRAEFWTPYWGACVDRFGTRWQVSVEGEQHS